MSERDSSIMISGKVALVGFVLGIPVLFLVTWLTLRNVEAKLATGDAPLVWAERANWATPPIKRTTLEDKPGEFGRPPKGKWVRLDFHLSPEVEAVVKEAAALAASEDFASDATGAALRELAARRPAVIPREGGPAEQPHGFYLDYLLGAWHQARGEAGEAEAAYTRAFAGAPAVIKVRFEYGPDEPAAGLRLEPAELAHDRVVDGDPSTPDFEEHLDQSLKLVYPHLVTDETGTIYLPAFHTVYRWARVPESATHDLRYWQTEGWFQFPGRIGAPRPAAVRPLEAGAGAGSGGAE